MTATDICRVGMSKDSFLQLIKNHFRFSMQISIRYLQVLTGACPASLALRAGSRGTL